MLHDVLGLTPDETAAYRQLVALPSTSPDELADLIAVTRPAAATLLSALERQGLASRGTGAPDRFVAAPPVLALGALLAKRQNEIRLAEMELGSIEELYRASSARRSAADVVDLVQGSEAVAQRFEQLQLGAREEVLAFVKPPTAVTSGPQNTAEDRSVARGVRYRVVLERRALDEDGAVEQARQAVLAGEQVRVTDSLPIKLLMVDNEFALMPMAAEAPSAAFGALLVHESGLLDALLALFESVWAESIPLVASGRELTEGTRQRLEELDARILGLLLTGFTDNAVANQLGMSLRTVQRRVRYLMDLARVETRMQLGWQASRLGWV